MVNVLEMTDDQKMSTYYRWMSPRCPTRSLVSPRGSCLQAGTLQQFSLSVC